MSILHLNNQLQRVNILKMSQKYQLNHPVKKVTKCFLDVLRKQAIKQLELK
ncbi:unnamed protein product [Paramecium sonneborni]|uniref:Uncharacterized protein n=1 Tax=Paramecium sonneborni TaxID=65129 RepID=A0A8S1LP55_9CILI|nr:unnamed protein product [Paramecium sonneborni]